MPSTITHAYFSMDIYERLDKKRKKLLNNYKDQFKAFAQGPDVFFFYRLLYISGGKKIRNLGHHMQRQQTGEFFINLIAIIKEKKLNDNPEIISFLYGFIAHYVLDMTIHPFVVYKAGIFKRGQKDTYKYFGRHEQIESYIDCYLIKNREKVKPANFKTHLFCFKSITISSTLEELINEAFAKTFNKKNIGEKYKTSLKHMKLFYKYFRNDRTGIKKMIYTLLQIFPFDVKLSAISYNIKLDNDDYYLNLKNEKWFHSLNKDDIYNYSFIQLYSIALSKALKLITEVNEILQGKVDDSALKELFPNLSYLTGRDCELGNGTYFSF